jgi:AAA15 family ATPase/GTPase
MLTKFSVRNFKSFKDWLTLDLSSVSNYEFNTGCLNNSTVNKALIYGHNGVGKSNLGLGIFDIVLHTTDKNKNSNLYANYTNADSDDDLSEFIYVFKFGENILQYKYGKKSFDDIMYEIVSINEEIVISYNRRENNELIINLPGTETLNKDLSQIKISIVKYIKSNTVLVGSPITDTLNNFFVFVDNMLLFWSLENRSYQGYETGVNSILADIIEKGHFDNFKQFLSDAGVESNIKPIEVNGEKKILFVFNNRSIDFWTNCSTGMRSLTLFYYWLQKVKFENNPPSLIFIDEFDAFYHLSISEQIVKNLIENKCQVILTTHNTSLMSNDLLRPDCYFLMHKNKITSLAHLTDKELRKAHNIEKMYRAGVFNE